MGAGIRRTARILVLDDDDRLLLFLTHWDNRIAPPRWLTPGGGIDAGETEHEAAVRELFEETGQRVDDLGEPVWRQTTALPPGHTFAETDATYYLWRTAGFTPIDTHWTPSEHDDVLENRWFTPKALAKSTENFDPEDVRHILAALR